MQSHSRPQPKPLSLRDLLERPDGIRSLPRPTISPARISGQKVA